MLGTGKTIRKCSADEIPSRNKETPVQNTSNTLDDTVDSVSFTGPRSTGYFGSWQNRLRAPKSQPCTDIPLDLIKHDIVVMVGVITSLVKGNMEKRRLVHSFGRFLVVCV